MPIPISEIAKLIMMLLPILKPSELDLVMKEVRKITKEIQKIEEDKIADLQKLATALEKPPYDCDAINLITSKWINK